MTKRRLFTLGPAAIGFGSDGFGSGTGGFGFGPGGFALAPDQAVGIFDLIDIGGGAITDIDGARLQDVRT